MNKQKSSCLISSINIRLLGLKRRFSLHQFFSSKRYDIDEIYGVFSDENSFQFVRESSIPFEEWEKVADNKCPFPYYELVHKRQFQLFSMDSGRYLTEPYVEDMPWRSGDTLTIDGHSVLPIGAKNFIPKSFIKCNRIAEVDLQRFSNFISRILLTDPTLLESYFPEQGKVKK